MQLKPEEIQRILDESKVEIVKSLKLRFNESVEDDIYSRLKTITSNEVEEWAKENLVPEIHRSLAENKENLIAAAINGAESISVCLAESLAAQLKENLESSWKRSTIFKAMFE